MSEEVTVEVTPENMGQIGMALALLALVEAGQTWYLDKSDKEKQDKLISAFSALVRTF